MEKYILLLVKSQTFKIPTDQAKLGKITDLRAQIAHWPTDS